MSTLLEEFINQSIIGPDHSTKYASLSLFKVKGVYYTQGRFGKPSLGLTNFRFFHLRANWQSF